MWQLSLAFFFVATFGVAWLTLVRASDSHTERWTNKTREVLLVFGALAWMSFFGWLAVSLHRGDWSEERLPLITAVVGYFTAGVLYFVVARRRPGLLGASPIKWLPSLEVLDRPPERLADWLFLDLRNVSKAIELTKRRGE